MEKLHWKNNRGSAALEATLVLPLFILGLVCFFQMAMTKQAEECVYEAAVETLEYMAEYAFIDDNGVLIPSVMFPKYVDDENLVKQYIKGGTGGVSFLGTIPLTDDDEVELHVQYKVAFSNPIFGGFNGNRSFVLRQRAYTGDRKDSQENEAADRYVYVTENREVYHSSRGCTYLTLSIKMCDLDKAVGMGYETCDFCRKVSQETVYITDYGKKYHSDLQCSGLKRTVSRIKLSETGGIPGCTRCVEK